MTYADKTWINKTGSNSEPGVGTDWEIIDSNDFVGNLQSVTDNGNSTTNTIITPIVKLPKGSFNVEIFPVDLTANRKLEVPNKDGIIATLDDIPSNPITGTGTANRIAKFTASGVVGNSKIFDNSTDIGIGNTNPRSLFHITSLTTPGYPTLGQQKGTFFLSGDTNAYGLMSGIDSSSGTFWMQNQRNDTVATAYNILFNPVGGNIGIGATTTPGARLDIRAQGALATDVVLRVRNSANTANLLSVNGQGTLSLGLQSSAPKGIEGAIYYNSTTKKHYGFDGTTWNALY